MLPEFHEQFGAILKGEMNGGVPQPTPWLTHLRHFIQGPAPSDVARKAQEIGGGEGDFTLREVEAGLSLQRIRAGEVKAQNENRDSSAPRGWADEQRQQTQEEAEDARNDGHDPAQAGHSNDPEISAGSIKTSGVEAITVSAQGHDGSLSAVGIKSGRRARLYCKGPGVRCNFCAADARGKL